LYFALKELDTHAVEVYRRELSALERTCAQIQKEKHLIKLLLTFQHGEKYYFLFEWADGNLGDYWEKHPEPPEHTVANRKWAAEQCLGLATAVKRIHGLATWQKERRNSSPRSLSPSSNVTTEDEREWGRHGDIKPNNILWFSSYEDKGNHLVLSDLGLTRYHSSATRSLQPHVNIEGYTGSYRPPEMDMQGQHICQKYDIWSLGCVYLEFCIWWLEGVESLQMFEDERATIVHYSSIVDEDQYFLITESNDKTEAKVKPIVIEVR
jgi:serine/threonine protein kinase